MQTVYILGAGFSRPLGGPLMTQLLTPVTYERMIHRFHTVQRDQFEKAALDLYRGHLGTHWSDPEEFLERTERSIADGKDSSLGNVVFKAIVEHVTGHINDARNQCVTNNVSIEFAPERFLAALPSHLQPFFQRRIEHKISSVKHLHDECINTLNDKAEAFAKELLLGAKRLLAVDCSIFFEPHHIEEDKWAPYREWLSKLSVKDTVITFNYDMVIERIAKHIGATNVRTRLPDDLDCATKVDVLKLHGSLHWSLQHSTVDASDDDAPVVLSKRALEPVMGTPGPEKLKLTTNVLKPLWEIARMRIRKAHRVVFLGYRLPPTDAYSRREFRDAFQTAAQVEQVQIVLGPPEVARDHAQRMKRIMIAMTPPTCRVEVLPFGTEDFLDLEACLLRQSVERLDD